MMNILGLLLLPKEQRKFLNDYFDMVSSFQFHVKTYRGKGDNLPIQNADLWIESYIDIIPDLQDFRDYVRKEMERLGIEKHPDHTYDKKYNHYSYSNAHTIQQLSDSLNSK